MTGRRMIVTGSTRGIGRAVAERLLAQGHEVMLHGSRENHVAQAIAELLPRHPHVKGFAADLSDRAALASLAASCGEVDGLINNAGVYEEEALENVNATSWARQMDVNVTAAWLLTRHLLPSLLKRKGVVVNIASDAAQIGVSGASVYCASKGAMVGLTKALAIELAPDVRAICICPGPVDTDIMRRQISAAADPVSAEKNWQGFAPMRRVARPEEIAALVAVAAGDETGFATGSVWNIDGGHTAGKMV